ncbi:MAG: OsmC family protein [Isosphaeraceae bacterium]
MNADELRELQTPLKTLYRDDPAAAVLTLKAGGKLDPSTLGCRVETAGGSVVAGLHPAAGGDGSLACSAEMLLEALVACAGVTIVVVATAIGATIRGGFVSAEGDLDFRGTLGIDKNIPVGLTSIRLRFDLDTDAGDEQITTLRRLAERYCVVFQTLMKSPSSNVEIVRISN